jgi:hypothetical protein
MANNQMLGAMLMGSARQPQAQFGGPVLGPDVMEKQQAMQQNQMLAQLLLSRGDEPNEGQMISGHYVPPSAAKGITNALQSYMGYKTLQDLPKQQQELQQMQAARMAQAFGLGQTSGQSAQAFPVDQGGQAQAPQQSAGMGQPQVPLLPGRSAQESFMVAQNIGLPAYFKMVGDQGNTMTDIQKNLVAQGIQPGSPQWNAALGANTEKQNYIAPINAAPGAVLVDPRTGQQTFSAPKDGVQMQIGPDGVAKAIPVPGYSSITAQQEGDKARATADANAQFDLIEVPNPNGQGSTYMTRAQLAQQAQGGGAPQAKPDPRTGRADTITSLATEAGDILKNASNGLIGSLKTSAADTAGFSTKESQADARLKVISGQLVMNMPRMEGPQSDADRLLYQQMAGDIANPKIPRETRAAALQTMVDLQKKYATPQMAGGKPVSSAGGLPSPKTAQEMQALPSGTTFRAPDGSIRKVP